MFQLIQISIIAHSLLIFIIMYFFARKRQFPIYNFGFCLVVLAYSALSGMSNIIRDSIGHYTSLRAISEEEYSSAAQWWILSITLYCGIYFLTRSENFRSAGGDLQHSYIRKYHGFDDFRNTSAVYVIFTLSIFILSLKFFNPYSKLDFGTITASSYNDLQVGGLLVDGILTYIYTALALAILPLSLWFGIPSVLLATYFLFATGSKGMAAGYIIFVYFAFQSRNNSNKIKITYLRKYLLMAGAILFASMLVVYSSRTRFGEDDISLISALSSSVGRFTQQDVSAVVYTFDEWRSAFQIEYVKGNLLAFLPGFLFPLKPINPAYEINNIYGGNFTAASPSIFGALFIIFNTYGYWIALPIFSYLSGKFDNRIHNNGYRMNNVGYAWLILQFYVAILEANFVIAAYLTVIAWHWSFLASKMSKFWLRSSVRNASK